MEILFNWIGGATFVMTIGNLNIACDPVLCEKGKRQDFFWFKSKRLEEPMYDEKTFSEIDLWLVTHNHEDHLDSLGLSKIDNKSKVVTNGNTSQKLTAKGIAEVTVLDWHKTKKFSIKGYEIEVEAIPAIHGVNPLSAIFAGKVNRIAFLKIGEKEKMT